MGCFHLSLWLPAYAQEKREVDEPPDSGRNQGRTSVFPWSAEQAGAQKTRACLGLSGFYCQDQSSWRPDRGKFMKWQRGVLVQEAVGSALSPGQEQGRWLPALAETSSFSSSAPRELGRPVLSPCFPLLGQRHTDPS